MFLLTGATGFIGSHLTELLDRRGLPYRCLVRASSDTKRLRADTVVRGDLASGEGLAAALDGVDCVLHLAGVTKALRVDEYYRGNAQATQNLVAALQGRDVRLVHVSSLAAAGPSPDGRPLAEDAEPRPFTNYGKSKLEAESAALTLHNVVVVRPPVVYGPRDTDVFQLLKGVNQGIVTEIAGPERWFSAVYAPDLVQGILRAAESNVRGHVYYICHPQPLTWDSFSMTAAKILNKRPKKIVIPYAMAKLFGLAGEVYAKVSGKPSIISREKIAEAQCTHWTCTPERAERELGFVAATAVEEGLRETLAWYREARWL